MIITNDEYSINEITLHIFTPSALIPIYTSSDHIPSRDKRSLDDSSYRVNFYVAYEQERIFEPQLKKVVESNKNKWSHRETL